MRVDFCESAAMELIAPMPGYALNPFAIGSVSLLNRKRLRSPSITCSIEQPFPVRDYCQGRALFLSPKETLIIGVSYERTLNWTAAVTADPHQLDVSAAEFEVDFCQRRGQHQNSSR